MNSQQCRSYTRMRPDNDIRLWVHSASRSSYAAASSKPIMHIREKTFSYQTHLCSPLPWDWRTEVRGEVITSEEHTRAVSTMPSENVKRQARYKSFPTDHINGGHRGVARRQPRQRHTKPRPRSKGSAPSSQATPNKNTAIHHGQQYQAFAIYSERQKPSSIHRRKPMNKCRCPRD